MKLDVQLAKIAGLSGRAAPGIATLRSRIVVRVGASELGPMPAHSNDLSSLETRAIAPLENLRFRFVKHF